MSRLPFMIKWIGLLLLRVQQTSTLRNGRLERPSSSTRREALRSAKAASLAGLSIWEFLEELGRRRIPVQYSAEEFMADFQAALAE